MGLLDLGWTSRVTLPLVGVGIAASYLVALLLAPIAIRKLRGAGIVGRDKHKEGRPEVAEMGGVIVFAGMMAGVFALVALTALPGRTDANLLSAVVVACGACLAGVMDDLIALRQRFKALLPLAFSLPLALAVQDTRIWLPLAGAVDFGIWYPIILVPLAITSAANGFNMYEGFNGLGAGNGILIATGMGILAWTHGDRTALLLLAPLLGALLAFWEFNRTPARAFPGDAGTLLIGSTLASASILGKLEFAGACMFLLVGLEFAVKARHRFPTSGAGLGELRDGRLYLPAQVERPQSVAQWLLKWRPGLTERGLVRILHAAQAAVTFLAVAWFLRAGPAVG